LSIKKDLTEEVNPEAAEGAENASIKNLKSLTNRILKPKSRAYF